MRVAVCEDHAGDKALLLSYIQEYFARMGYMGEVSVYETGEALLADFSPGAFDIIFLDIYLPGASGMEAARKIRESDADCLLVFVTMSADHSMDGFDVRASGYVVKPIEREKMDKALYMCREVLERNARAIEVPSGREGSVLLPVTNIQYVEVYGRESLFHLHGGVVEARLGLDDIEKMLGGGPFLRCHRSYIVNMNHVEKIGADDFLMKNGDLVPMRVNGRKDVKIAFATFTSERRSMRIGV